MTDFSHIEDDHWMVEVKAQVMTRDENKGGWVPLGRGGVSRVGLIKRPTLPGICVPSDLRHEYRIYGMLDQSEVLNCVFTKEVRYIIANPTFHHWHTEDKRFGLTFQTSRDANVFEQGIEKVVADLFQGATPTLKRNVIQHLQRLRHNYINSGEGNVFVALDLPLVRTGSGSTVSTATTTTTSSPQSPLHSIHEAFQHVNNNGGSSCSNVNQQHIDDEPVMHKVVYLPHRGGIGHNTSSSKQHGAPSSTISSNVHNYNSSTRSNSSDLNISPDNTQQQTWITHENITNYKRASSHKQQQQQAVLLAKHDITAAIHKATDDPDLDFDGSASSYVKFEPKGRKDKVPQIDDHHDYSYPSFESSPTASQKRSPRLSLTTQHSIEEIKMQNFSNYSSSSSSRQPPLPTVSKKRDRRVGGNKRDHRSQCSSLLQPGGGAANTTRRCHYCDETYRVDENTRGSCPDAPDTGRDCINRVTCLCCARGVLYHCVSKEDYEEDPYSCDTRRHDGAAGPGARENDCKKWTILTLLTFFVPCLWCYCFLRSCHRCGVACGCCGGRHKHDVT